jgi:DNA polymerase-1
MNDVLIIDGNNVAFRVWSTIEEPLTANFTASNIKEPDLGVKGGDDITVVYELLRSLTAYLNNPLLRSKEVVIVWDYGKSSYRKELYPEYKANREYDGSMQTYFTQLEILYKILSCFPVRQLRKKNVEGDDLIALTCKLLSDKKKIIVTADKDLSQLVDENTYMYKLAMKKDNHSMITLDNFNTIDSKTTIPSPKHMIDYKAIMGDPSDNIAKIQGIGPVAMNALFSFGNLNDALEAYLDNKIQDSKLIKTVETIIANIDLLNLNYQLVDLERAITIENAEYVWGVLNSAIKFDHALIRVIFMQLGFVSLLSNFMGFSQVYLDLS